MLGVPLLVVPVLQLIGVPDNRFVTVFFVTAVVFLLMVYVIMPRYTALVRKWLFN